MGSSAQERITATHYFLVSSPPSSEPHTEKGIGPAHHSSQFFIICGAFGPARIM